MFLQRRKSSVCALWRVCGLQHGLFSIPFHDAQNVSQAPILLFLGTLSD